MSQHTRDVDERPVEPSSWLAAEVEGRTVGFWIAVAVAIAVVVIGFGAWWVWGLGQGMPMNDDMASGMEEMSATDVHLPPVAGLYDGQQVFFVHPEASDAEVAGMLSDMMGGSPVLVVPELAEVDAAARDEVFVFTNGIADMGPFGFQPDVFASVPGDEDYSPLRTVMLVAWHDEDQARELTSADEIQTAADADEVELEQTDVVVNMPMLTWPGGQR